MTTTLFDLTGRIALVTGSTQGIGLALAEGLAAQGATIVINGRDPNRLSKTIEMLQDKGIPARGSLFDATDRRQVDHGIDSIETHIGPIDILVNNAGMQFRAPLEDFPPEQWDALIRTNLTSVFLVSQTVARRMIPRGRGKIVNIGSVQSELARPSIAPYAATKGAVRNLTRGMCADWAKHGLQVNAIGPGYFRTPLNRALTENPEFSAWLENRTPAGRWGEVGELVGAAVFLSSDASSFVNGQMLYVDGGITATV
ncbi:MAG: SDR family oxidoreductase [Rhizobiaceae bacterium]|nr:SDR family oxidoreductase [Rhizobiaceae bacterium]